jgi:mono/diheme cytochrome c family protein
MSFRDSKFAVSMGVLVVVAVAAGTHVSAAGQAGPERVDFQRDVRPILADNCFQCHGPDEGSRQAGLRLDTRDGALGARPRGAAVVASDVEDSLLYRRITHGDDGRRMPPVASNKSLTDDQIDLLRRWIEEGASWDQHWSFEDIGRPTPPAVTDEAWVRNPVDRFILARLDAAGLRPSPDADKRTLARRVALDLTGLPPDPGTLATFLDDTSDTAYETLVDRLLDSRHWGEHRARYWLDAARYGDTHGIHIDNYREMYAYRDWAIRAFNDNKPFDVFTVEQLAGDLLPEPTLDQLVATGFQRNNITTNEGGVVPEEYEAVYAKDRAETTGSVFLGLTVGCATCHDHKFDPIAQREFYAMTAFFRNTTQYVMDGNVSDPPPILVVPDDADRDRWQALRREAADIETQLEARAASVEPRFVEWLTRGEHRQLKTPLEPTAEILTMALEDPNGPAVMLAGTRRPIMLNQGAAIEDGPDGHPALMFGDESWAELPSLSLDSDTPFSIAMWIYQPEDEGNFVVAGQYDQQDGSRGWAVTIGSRQLSFRMTGDRAAPNRGATSARVGPINTKRMPTGAWTHIVVTHDGTGERGGLHVYRDGDQVEEQGSEFFAKAEGRILTDQPLWLGRGDAVARDGAPEVRHFSGGGIADLRVFNRVLTVHEAKVVSEWRGLEGATVKSPQALQAEERDVLRLRFLGVEDDDYRRLVGRQQGLEREWREIRRRGSVTHVMQERPDTEPEAHVLYRGMYDDPRDRVVAGTPAVLPPMAETLPRNRLGLARWLVDDANPLTSRVTVNRFWQQVFGTGLVQTSEDFGAQGEAPSHPALLDYLAVEFRESGWDVKQFFRTLVTSATYRQSASTSPDTLERDPENRLLSRGARFRMDAEMVRDYALAASGLLVRTIGGPSVKPYQPPGVWSTVAMPQSNTGRYEQDTGEKLYRRSLYTFWKRSAPPASMDIFNAPTREHTTVRRERTNTPLQALVTMNDTQFVEASRYLAQRTMREAGDDFDRRLDYLTTRLLARDFTDRERVVAKRTYDGFLALYRTDTDEARRLLDVGDSAFDAALSATESAAWTMLASQVMNLDEVLNK